MWSPPTWTVTVLSTSTTYACHARSACSGTTAVDCGRLSAVAGAISDSDAFAFPSRARTSNARRYGSVSFVAGVTQPAQSVMESVLPALRTHCDAIDPADQPASP